MRRIYQLALLIFSIGMLTACGDDDKPTPKPNPPVEEKEPMPDPISEFIWNGLDVYYLWEADVDALQLKSGTEEWKKYLNGYGSEYEELFESLLYIKPDANGSATVDRWSWFIYDWVEQENAFAGISKSFGYEYRLSKYSDSDGVYGYVTYVVPNSPAAEAGVKRGDIFVSVNETDLDVSNYRDLLYGNDSYDLGLADLDVENNIIIPNDNIVTISAIELTENPILLAKTLDINGTKVGYMAYNSFTGTDEFNLALNDSIGRLKNEGATELVLDLRYNGGGSTYTALILASMIDGNHVGEVFNKRKYNDMLQNYYTDKYGESFLEEYFTEKIENWDGEQLASINSLGLSRVFVLTSDWTASASELIINGLRPYMDVVLIGTQTHGKYTFSITVKDFLDNGEVNPKHKYAMQPIVGKSANAEDNTDYGDGFAPDYIREEWDYLGNIKPLGDPEEAFLKAALDVIAGNNPPVEDNMATRSGEQLETIFDSKELKPFGRNMYDDRIDSKFKDLTK
ncbi:peptidase S41-like protein [Balneicella halophila]|uniref:Peptidase S41-like protein n=1 Tax=Balneicella halophila TaxID=1537566 RepID=A0A7L4URM4_BALHA|nr:S41 family peptidase [Balneicella halophila]PVX52309.1 peptidase S41-like protein [Balneicella halophila]